MRDALTAPSAGEAARAEIIRLMREDFDPTPPNYEGPEWWDNAEDVADKILAVLPSPSASEAQVKADFDQMAMNIWRNLGFVNDRLSQVPILASELRKLFEALSTPAPKTMADILQKQSQVKTLRPAPPPPRERRHER